MAMMRQGVGLYQCGAHLTQIGQDAVQLAGGYHASVDGLLQHLRFLGRHIGTARRGYGIPQGHAGCQQQADASRGMVNSAMTRMDDTARNLLYIGT